MNIYISQIDGIASPTSPISHAVVAGNICHISGQLATDEMGKYKPGPIEEETRLAFHNLLTINAAAGFSLLDIVFVDIAFATLRDLPMVNQIYDQQFPEDKKPARTIYQAAALPFGGKVKITAVAIKT